MKAVVLIILCCVLQVAVRGQDSTNKVKQYKNVVRYNLSGALLFGIDKYVVMGYERLVRPNQSFSINIGAVELPRFVSIITDSLELSKDVKSSGFNVSIDYRFYLAKENKHAAPHGVYIGPYYSFNQFNRKNQWDFTNGTDFINTDSKFTINTIGFELGYQFILWKRVTLDLLMVGPGVGIYNYKATFDDNLDPAVKEQLRDGLQQLLTQKFPGMNYVFSDKEMSANGALKTTTLGYRYIVQVGFLF